MRKWKWLAGLLALPLIWLVVVLSLRALGPSEEQKRAVALMSAAPFEIKRDAFAALWLMPFNVPEGELEAVARRDIEAFNTLLGSGRAAGFQSLASKDYARLPDWDEGLDKVCQTLGAECRTHLRTHPGKAANWLDLQQRRVRKIEALSGYDGLSPGFKPSVATPFVPFTGTQSALATSVVMQFDRGEQVEAIDRLCRNALAWRRLGARSDTLLARMVGVAYVRQSAEWIAQLSSEWSATAALPPSCTEAFAAPELIDVDMCGTMQGEWRYASAGIRDLNGGPAGVSPPRIADVFRNMFLFDANASAHLYAMQLVHYCGSERSPLLLDPADIPETPVSRCGWRDRMHNGLGCSLSEVSTPAYTRYRERTLDHGARLRLMAGLLWWRAQPDSSEFPADRLARMPSEFFSATRPIELVDEGRALRIRLLDQSQDTHWQVPLPASDPGEDRGGR